MAYRSQRFDPEVHDAGSFTCGEPSLDDWLRDQAAAATVRRTARTWVWLDPHGTVVAYYALAAHRVAREEVPTAIGRGGPREIPAVLLARLALSTDLRGQGLGAVLVADAMARIIEATRTVAARLVVVDALHENVAQFYESLGFRRLPNSLLLVQKISDIETALDRGDG
ncbi:MAG TPA: GNAT family N-acetyltransferase [Sporichthyaceae bacterium]|jgi:GNAT superfamily N-acetyltransferase|nr:GNAT family N-acetyltransferase [Sporichthyaceae bacterium]